MKVTDAAIHRFRARDRRIAFLGLSAFWHHLSLFFANYLQRAGYRIVPVNSGYAGEPINDNLSVINQAIDAGANA